MVVYRWLADTVVVFHAAYVSFVIVGLLAVSAGVLLRWSWIRNPYFRWIHFFFIAVVVIESLFGVECPLTTWENDLRRAAGEEVAQGTFIGRCAHEFLFYDAPDWVFTVIYCVFGAVVLAVMLLVPPRWPARWLPRRNK
jgi:uncharacterized protein (DUF983 family)